MATTTTTPLARHNAALARSLGAAGLLDEARVRPLLTRDVVVKLTVRPRVAFGAKAVVNGAFFRAGECKERPRVLILKGEGDEQGGGEGDREDEEEESYLFMMVDPDAPSPDDYRFAFWRHLVWGGLRARGGVEGKGEEGGDGLGSGRELTAYLGPGPKDDSKPHRYLFLAYREPAGGLALEKADVGGEEFVDRRSFQPVAFAEKHGLTLAGVDWMTCAGDGWVADQA